MGTAFLLTTFVGSLKKNFILYEKFFLEAGRKIHHGDVAQPNVTLHHGVYVLTKTGNVCAQCGMFFYDSV